jgi:hypothetical protein
MFKDKCSMPNKLISKGLIPRVPSTENIFTPINSAMMALAIKKLAKMMNSLVSFVLNIIILSYGSIKGNNYSK